LGLVYLSGMTLDSLTIRRFETHLLRGLEEVPERRDVRDGQLGVKPAADERAVTAPVLGEFFDEVVEGDLVLLDGRQDVGYLADPRSRPIVAPPLRLLSRPGALAFDARREHNDLTGRDPSRMVMLWMVA
jgi:hypothetical protein